MPDLPIPVPFGSDDNTSSTVGFYDKPDASYAPISPLRSNNPYDIEYAFQQQALKSLDGSLRMSLSIPYKGATNGVLTFRAHIDPSHISIEQSKRFAQLDTLDGVIMQDFGYTAELIELKGTTGSAYYREIGKLDAIFNSQSVQGQPTVVTLTIESRTYQCAWKNFSFARLAASGPQASVIQYIMNFVVLYRGAAINTSQNLYQAQVPSATTINADFNGANAILSTVSTNGLSPAQYLLSSPDVPLASYNEALAFVAAYWDKSLNGNASYPGNDIALLPGQLLTIPTNWSDVL